MVFKSWFMIACVGILTGCMTQHSSVKQNNALKYETTMKKNQEDGGDGFQSGKFPYYHWNAPIVQEVAVPAHIRHGVFIPEHQELVLIKPGQWAKNAAYPISTQKEHYEKSDQNNHGDVMADITSIP